MRAILSMLALVLIALPAVASQPGDASAASSFSSAGVPDKLVFVVPEARHVQLTITLQTGAATELLVQGPGLCHGTLDTTGVQLSKVQKATFVMDCGKLQPSNYDLSLRATGVLSGSVRASGSFFVEQEPMVPAPRSS